MGSAFSGTEDLDKSFAYDTKQLVNIKDRYLGFTVYALQTAIISYIVLGVFLYGEGYLENDQTKGLIATHVQGDTVAVSSGKAGTRYFSAEELTYPGLENGNVFVATRQNVYHQKRGTCEDHARPCSVDAECTAALNGTCSAGGYCEEVSWCDQDEIPEMYELNTKDFHIWVKSAIQFVKLERNKKKDPFGGSALPPPWIFSTEKNHPYPEHMYNLFSVSELLLMCKPVPIRYEEVSELGAAIEVVFNWKCDMSNTHCKPDVQARRLDVLIDPEHIGFSFKWSEYVADSERMLYEMRGIRIFFRTVGRGTMFDTNALIMKLATTTSLLCVAPIIADLIMLNIFARRQRYQARKLEVSPDFTQYFHRLREKKKAQKESRLALEDEAAMQAREDEWQRRLREEED
mmetsp:Transcript_48636/g.122704  ORF Transcript_48636/g.122704 Transcript_48636/m.122704 type:complete len:403 (-) Transcript_48636:34-1242(-)